MNLTRRSALAALGAPLLFAQAPNKIGIGYIAELAGTRLAIVGEEGNWFVGLNSDEHADFASVDVFYEKEIPYDEDRKIMVLLHKNSPCPLVSGPGMAITDFNFALPLKDVRFIRVTLLKTVARREFR
jgi:hypothetical protein